MIFWGRMGYTEAGARRQIGKPCAPLALLTLRKTLAISELDSEPEPEAAAEAAAEPEMQLGAAPLQGFQEGWTAVDLSWKGDPADQRCSYVRAQPH